MDIDADPSLGNLAHCFSEHLDVLGADCCDRAFFREHVGGFVYQHPNEPLFDL